MFDGQIGVGHRLCLDALGGVDDEYRAFACSQGTGHFIGEVDVSGRIDEVQLEVLPVVVVVHRDGRSLDRNSTLSFEIHGIEQLIASLTLADRLGRLEQAVGQGAFPMVDVGNDGEVADRHRTGILSRAAARCLDRMIQLGVLAAGVGQPQVDRRIRIQLP